MRTAMLRTLGNAIRYLHLQAQLAQSRDEYEDFSIALKLLGLLCDGWSEGPYLFNLACSYATGLPHARYLRRRAEREEFQRLELARCIPDYDYSREPRLPDRDPSDGRRHLGERRHWSGLDTQAIKEAAAKLGLSENAIYLRLRRGWTWEQATSEPLRQGRRLYGTQFCNLAGKAITGDDARATRPQNENHAGTGERSGMWTTAESRHFVPSRAGAPGQASLLAPDRRKPPKSIRSVAQRQQIAGVRARVFQGVSYFGA